MSHFILIGSTFIGGATIVRLAFTVLARERNTFIGGATIALSKLEQMLTNLMVLQPHRF